jgi:leucyl aminopeptidase
MEITLKNTYDNLPKLVNHNLEDAIPVYLVSKDTLQTVLANLGKTASNWSEAQNYDGKHGTLLKIPNASGALSAVLFGFNPETAQEAFDFAKLSTGLKEGSFALKSMPEHHDVALLAFRLAGYYFDRYKSEKDKEKKSLTLQLPEDIPDTLDILAEGVCLSRDLINIPAMDLGPQQLAEAASQLAARFNASISITDGEKLKTEFPMIHAVGAAASEDRQPRLIDITWGREDAPKVTLVGKGVCFDTGGLDIKPSSSMLLMKKDMGGSACVLGLAFMIMASGLDVRLRVLIPAVENAISGAAFRPGDILQSRKGLSVEIGNTDAEGRLVLADALALADEEKPDIIINMATLTGAARVALGPDLPPFYTRDDTFAEELQQIGMETDDPLWQMPLWPRYDDLLSSKIADINHISSGPFAGSITAALFLQRFVEKAGIWAHFDVFGWTPSARPGRPEGGEAQGIRALFNLLRKRYTQTD